MSSGSFKNLTFKLLVYGSGFLSVKKVIHFVYDAIISMVLPMNSAAHELTFVDWRLSGMMLSLS